jgi:hypothetical protein
MICVHVCVCMHTVVYGWIRINVPPIDICIVGSCFHIYMHCYLSIVICIVTLTVAHIYLDDCWFHVLCQMQFPRFYLLYVLLMW